LFNQNRLNPNAAVENAILWWKQLKKAPHSEQEMIHEWSVFLRDHLSRENLLSLSLTDFIGVCTRIHALRDYALRISYSSLGYKPPYPELKQKPRIKALAKCIYRDKSTKGKSVLESLFYLLYGGPLEKTPDRIWDTSSTEEWRIPHLGISSLGEIVGWALPDSFPPRNGRTSKALKSFGFSVKIHSE